MAPDDANTNHNPHHSSRQNGARPQGQPAFNGYSQAYEATVDQLGALTPPSGSRPRPTAAPPVAPPAGPPAGPSTAMDFVPSAASRQPAEAPHPQHEETGEPSSSSGATASRQPHRRGPWSEKEDIALMKRVREIGAQDWGRVTKSVGSRTPKQCRERYFQNLRPDLNHEPITPEEGAIINEMVASHGKKWADIARVLKGRSDNAVKNWWNGNQNRKRRRDKETARVAEAQSQARAQSQSGPSSYTSHVPPASYVSQLRRSNYTSHAGPSHHVPRAGPSDYASHAGPSSHAQSRPPLYHPLPAQAPAPAPAPIHAPSYQAYHHSPQAYQSSYGADTLPSPATSDTTDRGNPSYSLSPGYHHVSAHQPQAQPQHQMSPRTALPHSQPQTPAGQPVNQYQLPPLEQLSNRRPAHLDDRAPRTSNSLPVYMGRYGQDGNGVATHSPTQQSPAQLPTAPASPLGSGRVEGNSMNLEHRPAPSASDEKDPRLSVRNLLQ